MKALKNELSLIGQYCTFRPDDGTDEIRCISYQDLDGFENGDLNKNAIFDSLEFVWQFAESEENAIEQHHIKYSERVQRSENIHDDSFAISNLIECHDMFPGLYITQLNKCTELSGGKPEKLFVVNVGGYLVSVVLPKSTDNGLYRCGSHTIDAKGFGVVTLCISVSLLINSIRTRNFGIFKGFMGGGEPEWIHLTELESRYSKLMDRLQVCYRALPDANIINSILRG